MSATSRGTLGAALTLGIASLFTTVTVTVTATTAPPAASLPEALKDVKRADGMCKREVPPPLPGASTAGAVLQEPQLQCAIEPPALANLLGRPDLLIADQRDAQSYAAFHIESSINIAWPSLRSKDHFKQKTVVLVGNGKSERELYSACAQLRKDGFAHVAVLRGGSVAWVSQGHPGQGEAHRALQGGGLSATELWAESQFDANVVLATPDRQEMQSVIQYSTVIPDATPTSIQRALDRRHKELPREKTASVILMTGSLDQDEDIQRVRGALQPTPVLVYAGTLEAYKRANAQQLAVWKARARGPKQLPCGR